jgi:hypothetical protein
MKQTFSCKFFSLSLLVTFVLMGNAFVAAQNPVDVYFIAGQSNAANIGSQNGTGTSDVGFNLTYGRVETSNAPTSPGTIADGYSSNLLDLDQAVNQLAVSLYQGNDIAIYTFGRAGKPLTNVVDTNDGGESWFPGDGTTNYDAELYGEFQNWSSARLNELSTAGNTATVKGVFWFQGERDVVLERTNVDNTAVDNYQTNFENLLSRFRDDFNNDVVIVASKLRIVTNSTQQALNDLISVAIENVAATDPLVGVVETTVNADGTGGPMANRFGGTSGFNTDVHFSNASQEIIVDRWSAKHLAINSPPQAQTIGFTNVTSHNHVSVNSNPIADASTITQSPFFAGAPASNGLSGDVAFNNNPVTTGPMTSATATIGGTFTVIGNSTAAGGFTDGNSLPSGITVTYDISFDLSTTTGALLSAGLSESNGLGAGAGDAFFAPANGNFSGNLIFGAATISNVSFTGSPTDAGFVFSNGTVDSIDLLGLASASFNGSNDAVLLASDNSTVLVDFTTDAASTTETLIDATNGNLFAGQELGNAIFAATNGGAHLRGFTLGANLSYEIDPSSLLGDVNLDGTVNFLDISPFIAVLSSGMFQAEADCNESGGVDFLDISPFIAILSGQ